MRVSKKAEYALRALIAIARSPKSWQIQELSAQENIPVKFLEQILLSLRRSGILSSKRGVGGGYSLRRSPDRVTVGEIIAVMDGQIAPVPCTAEPPMETCSCPNPRTCAVRIFMTQVRDGLVASLNAETLEDLARRSPGPSGLAYEI